MKRWNVEQAQNQYRVMDHKGRTLFSFSHEYNAKLIVDRHNEAAEAGDHGEVLVVLNRIADVLAEISLKIGVGII